ncbi:hypothetical protein ACPWT1_09885 [Ramlibacter sp. MMS24-I3-19]|uniref:hypothetical protein n=1 Tax=Ramlibacter sp. MMS24-I3-19 TaxID=3416606 RepID=UPI003D0293F5
MSAGSDRLDRSRLAILEHLHRREQRRHPPADALLDSHESGEGQAGTGARARPRRHHASGSWFERVREALDSWWRYHPAHMAVDIARPTLSSYARRKPAQYLGIAAAAGAVVFLLRPWKLISVTGVLVALVKSPQVAGLVMSALSTGHNPDDDPPHEE